MAIDELLGSLTDVDLSGDRASSVLERLTHPLPLQEFLSDIWERTFLHVTREQNPELSTYFASMASIDTMDELLTTTYAAGPRRPDAVRLGKGGVMIPAREYMSAFDGTLSVLDVNRVLTHFRSGASVILNGVHEALSPVAELCNTLSEFFGVNVSANAYITPPNAQGFPLHYDTHDVFLLQVAGEKDWDLYDSPVPLATPAIGPEVESGASARTGRLRLRAGEMLYLPRGLRHRGTASEATSFHLTIGVHPYTWAQLITDIVAGLEQDDIEFRRSVAPRLGTAKENDRDLEGTLIRLADRLRNVTRAERAARDARGKVRRDNRRDFRGMFAEIACPSEISLKTLVRRAPTDISLSRKDGRAIVESGDIVLRLPDYIEPHLRMLLGGEAVSGADLPDDLDDEGKLTLIRRMLEEGVVRLVRA